MKKFKKKQFKHRFINIPIIMAHNHIDMWVIWDHGESGCPGAVVIVDNMYFSTNEDATDYYNKLPERHGKYFYKRNCIVCQVYEGFGKYGTLSRCVLTKN